jgi:hypothetical protein
MCITNENSEKKRTIGPGADGMMVKLALNSHVCGVALSGSRYSEVAGLTL